MAVKDRIAAIPLTSLDATLFMIMTYTVVNANGLDNPCVILILNNDSDSDVIISYDGVTDHDFIASGEVKELNVQQNSQPQNNRCVFPTGTKVYVRSPGGAGMGTFYLSGYYQPVQ